MTARELYPNQTKLKWRVGTKDRSKTIDSTLDYQTITTRKPNRAFQYLRAVYPV
jgi:hypothetical protein